MKNIRKIFSGVLAVALLMSCFMGSGTVSAFDPPFKMAENFEDYQLSSLSGQENSQGTWSIVYRYASEDRGRIAVIDKSTIPDAEDLGLGTGKAVAIERISNPGVKTYNLEATYTFTQPLLAADMPNGAVFKARVYMPHSQSRLALLVNDGSTNMVNVLYRGKNNQWDGNAVTLNPGWNTLEAHLLQSDSDENKFDSTFELYLNGSFINTNELVGTDHSKIDHVRLRTNPEENTDYLETVYVDEVVIGERNAPSVLALAVSGTPKVGAALTADYTFSSDYDAEDRSIYQWQQDNGGNGNFIDIAGETSRTFVPTYDNVGNKIRVLVTPKDHAGLEGAVQVSAPTSGAVASAVLPAVTDAAVSGADASGAAIAGAALTGSYTYDNSTGTSEGNSSFRWLSSSAINGEYLPISGADGLTFVPTSDLIGKYIKFEVTPANTEGVYGSAVTSSPVLVYGGLINYDASNPLSGWSKGYNTGVNLGNDAIVQGDAIKLLNAGNTGSTNGILLQRNIGPYANGDIVMELKVRQPNPDTEEVNKGSLNLYIDGYTNVGGSTLQTLVSANINSTSGAAYYDGSVGVNRFETSPAVIPHGEWHTVKVVASIDRGRYTYYVDDVEIASDVVFRNTAAASPAATALSFGRIRVQNSNVEIGNSTEIYVKDMKLYVDGLKMHGNYETYRNAQQYQVTPGFPLSAKFIIPNKTGSAIPYLAILSLYNADGSLAAVSTQSGSAPANRLSSSSIALPVAVPESAAGGFVKLFIWNGFDDMRPVVFSLD